MRLVLFIVLFVSTALTTPLTIVAQQQLAAKDRAVVAFDLRLDQLRKSMIFQGSGAEEAVTELLDRELGPLPFDKIDRIFGAISGPDSIKDFEAVNEGGDIPLNFFVQVHLADAETVKAFFDDMGEQVQEVMKDGKTYYQPSGPKNIYLHTVNATTVEIGTEMYVFSKTRRFFTESLNGVWSKMPDHAIRIAADLESARKFVDEAVAIGKENLPEEAGKYLDLISQTATFQFSADLNSEQLLSLVATGTDGESTTNLQKGLDALLDIVRSGRPLVDDLVEQTPKAESVADEIMSSLRTTKNGNSVAININKPEGFDEAVTLAMERGHEAAGKVQESNNFKNYGLAVHNFHDTWRRLPFDPPDPAISEDLSWRVRVLPYLELNLLYEQMNIEEPHDGETNKKFVDQMPEIYGDDGKSAAVCWIVPEKRPKSFADIRDGMANTIMLMQTPTPVPWMQPKDLTVKEAVEIVMGLKDGEELHVVFYDGHVKKLDNTVEEETLNRLFDPADGKPVDFD